MAALSGTVIIDKISPGNTSVTFATHEDIYGQGGMRVVTTYDDLTAITLERQKEGMLVYVKNEAKYYALSSTSYPLTSFTNYFNVGFSDYLKLSGGTITGDLTVEGNLSAQGKLFGEGSSITNAIVTGKTIYVDANTGTDTRGTLSKYSAGSPFATIDAAVAASATLDTIRVRAGSYTISSTINLNLKGNLLFEAGATVNVASNIVAFSYSQNSVPISILGYANFVLAGGTAGVLTIPSGNATTAVQFECNSISGPNSVTGTLFNCTVGVLSVDAKLIQMTTTFNASNATVFNITGSGVVTARIPFVYCGVYLNAPSSAVVAGGAAARFNTDVWTLGTFNSTAGIAISSITTNIRIVNYNHAGGVVFNWTEDTVEEGHIFNGVRWFSGLGLPNMSFASSAGTTTKKIISLKESNVFKGSLTNSLSASVPMNVWVNNSYADVAASANVTFKVGSFTVDPLVGNM